MLRYDSIQSLIDAAERDGIRLSELCLRDQAEELEKPEEELYARMEESFSSGLSSSSA